MAEATLETVIETTDLRREVTRAVVDNLGLIWPDEVESMHEEVADAVLAAVRQHLVATLDEAIGEAAGVYDLTDGEVHHIIDRVLPRVGVS